MDLSEYRDGYYTKASWGPVFFSGDFACVSVFHPVRELVSLTGFTRTLDPLNPSYPLYGRRTENVYI